MRHDSFIYESWLFRVGDMAEIYMWHDSLLRDMTQIHNCAVVCDMTHSCMWSHVPYMNESCLIWMSHVSYEWVMSRIWMSHVSNRLWSLIQACKACTRYAQSIYVYACTKSNLCGTVALHKCTVRITFTYVTSQIHITDAALTHMWCARMHCAHDIYIWKSGHVSYRVQTHMKALHKCTVHITFTHEWVLRLFSIYRHAYT